MGLRKGLLIIETKSLEMVYGPAMVEAIGRHVHLIAPPQTRESIENHRALLQEVEVIFGGWGMPRIDADFLSFAPKLQAIFYAAGAVDGWARQALWNRGIIISTAIDANSIPVAEYTLATILFSLKHGWGLSRRVRAERTFPDRNGAPGAFKSKVGIVSLGSVGRRVVSLLRPFDLDVIAYDPFISDDDADLLHVERATLDDIFERCDVVTIHTPELPETRGMINGRHLAAMKPGATLINTSRGSLIREEEMLDVLQKRSDLQVVLDTTAQEPPEKDSRLYSLDNVMLTPHIAGSAGPECRRMAQYMVEELERYVNGQPLKWAVTCKHDTARVDRPASKSTPAIAASMKLEFNPKVPRKTVRKDPVLK